MQKNYYYKANIYEVESILRNGFVFNYQKTDREFGFAYYLSDQIKDNNIEIKIQTQYDTDILTCTTFESLLTNYLNTFNNNINTYINKFGRTPRLATKYINPFINANHYKGLRILNENLFVLYTPSIIKKISFIN